MKLPTKVHGVLDYLTGVALLIIPPAFNFPDGAASQVPMLLGGGAIAYSLLTRYEWGLFKLIPMRGHLLLDFLSGVVLALSPWLFGFGSEVWLPHVAVGLFEIGAALMTESEPRGYRATPGAGSPHPAV